MADLREVLYREKEEALDKLDAMLVYASFVGYVVTISVNKSKVCITFDTGSEQGYMYFTIKDRLVDIGSDITFYVNKIHNKLEQDFDKEMGLDKAIDIVMKIL